MPVTVSFSRIYSFSAAHRLHSGKLSPEQNRKLYDKCNNQYGHGHDYKLEVTVSGPVNQETGMIIALPEMDKTVQGLLKLLDHKHLNYEVPYFEKHIPTGEVIIRFLWDELDKRFSKNLLYHLKLWETNNNYFELERSAGA